MEKNKHIKIGISGARGSFSESAAEKYAYDEKKSITIDYLISVAPVLSSLEKGEIEKGIFPIENSNGGIVLEAVHAMAEQCFTIEKIFEIDIHHCLLVKKGVSASSIVEITSHDQALKQCRMYLKRKWAGVEIKEYKDTARAAEDLSQGVLKETVAVIASKKCANLYALDILEESIQDLKFNFTTFVVAKKKDLHPF
jgi:prephenate dehydratase